MIGGIISYIERTSLNITVHQVKVQKSSTTWCFEILRYKKISLSQTFSIWWKGMLKWELSSNIELTHQNGFLEVEEPNYNLILPV